MTEEDTSQLSDYDWMQSRIPVLPALCAFTPDDGAAGPEPIIEETLRRISSRARWYVVEGGLRLVMPYHGEPFDSSRFTIEPGGWDFDSCDVCQTYIAAMTLCWVTKNGPYFILCVGCHERYVASKKPKPD
jgi:hypothetical protein